MKRRALRWAGLIVGAALMVWAVVTAVQAIDMATLGRLLSGRGAVMLAAAAGNLMVTSVLFWVITLSFDARPRVSLSRMTALIAASGLLNYLPLQAGLFGRAAYLKAKHGLPLRQAMVIQLVVLGVGSVVLGGAAAVGLMYPVEMLSWGVAGAGLALVALCAATPWIARLLLRRPAREAWSWGLLRAVDLLLGAARLWLAFASVGQPIGYARAVTITAAGMFVSMLPFVPNGLGLREWVIAALAPMQTAAGLAAAVIDRAVEAVVLMVGGGAGIGALQRGGERRAKSEER
jgi:uncharacterized membrane protein YbhN (UPF0104 family)